jgi:hypothetical protein
MPLTARERLALVRVKVDRAKRHHLELDMEIKNPGKITKCMNPEMDCPNIPDPASAYTVILQGKPIVLCKQCGPYFQRKAELDKKS